MPKGRPFELLGSFSPMSNIHVEIANGPLEMITANTIEPGIELTKIQEDEMELAM